MVDCDVVSRKQLHYITFTIVCLNSNTHAFTWISFLFTGKTINECRLVLHAMTTAVCQLYLVLLHLRHAAQHAAWTIFQILFPDAMLVRYCTDSERLEHVLKCYRSGAVHFLEAVCLILESLAQSLTVVSTLCVAIKHVPQAALFLIASTVRWAQQMLLFSNEDMDAWEKEQKKPREEIQKQRGQMEQYLNPDQLTRNKRRWELHSLKQHLVALFFSTSNLLSASLKGSSCDSYEKWRCVDLSLFCFKTASTLISSQMSLAAICAVTKPLAL